jgi:polysaccharide biosynthesis/export protein
MIESLNAAPSGARALRSLLPVFLLPLAACSMLPSAGPDTADIAHQYGQNPTPPFALVDLTTASMPATPVAEKGFAEWFGDTAGASDVLIGVGDGINIDIWETGSDPLFGSRAVAAGGMAGSRGTSLPELTVAADGSVRLPFAGRIPVAGLTPAAAEQALTKALAGKTPEPQLMVRVRNNSSAVTLIGDATGSTRVPLTARRERLLDVLASAGGVKAGAFETRIQLTRAGVTRSESLQTLLQSPRDNIPLMAGDVVVALRQPQSFTAFGATGRNAQIEFGAGQISLIEAVARTGGLLDSRADPRGVYLLRQEPRAALAGTGIALPVTAADGTVPVVYQLDLMQAGSYFRAQRFMLRDRDILYVSSAATNELQKFLELVGLLSQPVIQGAVVHGALK